MADCRECAAPIFFAWDRRFDKWVPVDMICIRGDETEYESGVYRESHHLRHRCGFTPAVSLGAPNPHRVLFVAQDAPKEVIRAAYLALSKVYHPDFGGSADAQIELNEAYEGAMAGARSVTADLGEALKSGYSVPK